MSKYVNLANVGSNYAKRMNRLSNRIFGEVARPSSLTSMKAVTVLSEKPVHKNPEIYDYYPRHVETQILMRQLRLYGLFRDEHMDFKDEMERMRELRGKGKRAKWWAKIQEQAAKRQQQNTNK